MPGSARITLILATSSAGVALSLITAVLWAISPMCFASAGRRIGSLRVLLLRSFLATSMLIGLLPVYAWFVGGNLALPTLGQTGWLVLSGLAGMAAGDAFAYESLVVLGPRRTTQILTLSPVTTVLLGWWALGEQLGPRTLVGIVLVLAGTSYVAVVRPPNNEASREPGRVSASGIAMAVAAAFCIGIGTVAARQAFRTGPALNVVVATVVRVGSCALIVWMVPLAMGSAWRTLAHLREPEVRSRMVTGVAAGPFVGMLCYLLALKQTEAGVVSTLVSMSPLFILPIVIVRYRTRIGPAVAIATAVAVGGVALITLR